MSGRKAILIDELAYREYMLNFVNFKLWIKKCKEIIDKEGNTEFDIEKLLVKHRNLQSEIKAHNKYFESLIETGVKVSKSKKRENLEQDIAQLKTDWNDLLQSASNKLLQLDQADAYRTFCGKLNQVNYHLKKIRSVLDQEMDSSSMTKLRLYQKEQSKIESDFKFVSEKVSELCIMGNKMIEYKHSKASEVEQQLQLINKTLQNLEVRFSSNDHIKIGNQNNI